MKKISIILALCLIFSIFVYNTSNANVYKYLRVGNVQNRIVDNLDEGGTTSTRWFQYSYDNFYYRTRNVTVGSTYWGCKDWTDENGKTHKYKTTGCGGAHVDEITSTIPILDDKGFTIRKYVRHTPPSIIVDGYRLDEPFPLDESDEVNANEIPGTADIMIESTINTCMGLTINRKVLGWSQINHDDYIIYDLTFTNTGNIDLDDEIELQGQTINGLYFFRAARWSPTGHGPRYQNWYSTYGEHPEDTLRISYGYPGKYANAKYDDVGRPSSDGFLRTPAFIGEATIHVDKSPDDPTDWRMQPFMTGNTNCDYHWLNWVWQELTLENIDTQYMIFSQGFEPYDGREQMTEGVWPGSKHSIRMDELGIKWTKDLYYVSYHPNACRSSGPWDLEFGESIRFVYALVAGTISPRVGWDVGRAWEEGRAAETWEGGGSYEDNLPWNLPPQFALYPDFCDDDNDRAKDSWVFTGKDSLFQNANAAQWAVQHDYDVPIPPPPPSIEVNSRPDRIEINWGTESETAPDFAGYRVYRAIPTSDSIFWYPIYECGNGTPNALTHTYEDATAQRGVGYAYYVTAFDDGIANKAGVHGRKEVLESGKYYNETTLSGAHLTRSPAASLSDIRVVPNPFNIGAADLQYPGEENKIMFLDLPGYCTIKIYSESGDLIKTLYHTDGSGDESWGDLWQEWSATDDGQLVVSGIYIALIEKTDTDGTPTGESTAVKFVIVR